MACSSLRCGRNPLNKTAMSWSNFYRSAYDCTFVMFQMQCVHWAAFHRTNDYMSVRDSYASFSVNCWHRPTSMRVMVGSCTSVHSINMLPGCISPWMKLSRSSIWHQVLSPFVANASRACDGKVAKNYGLAASPSQNVYTSMRCVEMIGYGN